MKADGLFRVAILQKSAHGRDRDANTELLLRGMEAAAEGGADILLPPECFITGYVLPAGNPEAINETDGHIEALRRAAARLGVGVLATALTKGRDRPRNSAYVIGERGELLMKYSKVHTCDFAEEACLESGDSFEVCGFDGVKLGVMICYDREYPESARVLMLKGAEIVLLPNDCGSMEPRLKALSTRAYENMVGVAMANPPGKNRGNSCAYSPICWDGEGNCVDNTLLLADAETSGLFFADFDMAGLRSYRSREMMGNTFRKVKAYGELMNGGVLPPFVRGK